MGRVDLRLFRDLANDYAVGLAEIDVDSLAITWERMMGQPCVVRDEIIALTDRLLQAIFAGDWATYTAICADDITAIEPEGRGHLIQGLPFHQTYFPAQPPASTKPAATITISSPHVRVMGDAAVIAYVRLVQSTDSAGKIAVSASEETRVWQRLDGVWKHVHFHRSPL